MKLANYVQRWKCDSCGANSTPVRPGRAPHNWFQAEAQRNGKTVQVRADCVSCLGRAVGKSLGEGPWSHADHRTNLEDRRWFTRQERENWESRRQQIAADSYRSPSLSDHTQLLHRIERMQAPE